MRGGYRLPDIGLAIEKLMGNAYKSNYTKDEFKARYFVLANRLNVSVLSCLEKRLQQQAKRRSNGRLRSEHLKEETTESNDGNKSSGGNGKVSAASLSILQKISELPLSFRGNSAENEKSDDGQSLLMDRNPFQRTQAQKRKRTSRSSTRSASFFSGPCSRNVRRWPCACGDMERTLSRRRLSPVVSTRDSPRRQPTIISKWRSARNFENMPSE